MSSSTPLIGALCKYYGAICAAELDRALRKLEGGAEAEFVIEEFSRRLTNKVLHAPTLALNELCLEERSAVVPLMCQVFAIPETGRYSLSRTRRRLRPYHRNFTNSLPQIHDLRVEIP
jgi:glutamyl-tRNA reductase